MKEYYRIYEEQGADAEINRVVRGLAPRIREDWDEILTGGRYDMNDALDMVLAERQYVVELHAKTGTMCDRLGGFRYKVRVYTGWYSDDGRTGGTARKAEDWDFQEGTESYRISVNMYLVYNNERRVDLLEEILSHELMHTKTGMREAFNNGVDVNALLGAYGKLVDDNQFKFARYFLSPSERHSYVQGTYQYMLENTRNEIKRGGRADKEWFADAFKKSSGCRHMARVAGNIGNLDDDEIREYLESSNTRWLKKATGISTPDDFKRYFRKSLKDVGMKILKAAYKGYADALNWKYEK